VKHLILADPWGFPERPGATLSNKVSLPVWVKAIAYLVSPLNPLWAVRASGPLGMYIFEGLKVFKLEFEVVMSQRAHFYFALTIEIYKIMIYIF